MAPDGVEKSKELSVRLLVGPEKTTALNQPFPSYGNPCSLRGSVFPNMVSPRRQVFNRQARDS